MPEQPLPADPNDLLGLGLYEAHQPPQIILSSVFVIVNLLIIIACIQMIRRKTWGLAPTGSILSMVNFVSGCCCLGLPFGIGRVLSCVGRM